MTIQDKITRAIRGVRYEIEIAEQHIRKLHVDLAKRCANPADTEAQALFIQSDADELRETVKQRNTLGEKLNTLDYFLKED
jgi:hypothetical protein